MRQEEITRWIELIGNTVPNGKGDRSIGGMIRRWTKEDHQAVGTRLATESGGRARNVSIRYFAETVAEYEPETAAR